MLIYPQKFVKTIMKSMKLIVEGYEDVRNEERFSYTLIDDSEKVIKIETHLKGTKVCRSLCQLLKKFLKESDSPTIELEGRAVYSTHLSSLSSLVELYNTAVKRK